MGAMRACGILFHHFHDSRHPGGQGSLSAEDLDRIIGGLGRNRILGAGAWLEKAVGDDLDDGDLCLTFDDNLRCQYDVALPVLEARGITAFWFVYTAPLAGEPDRLELYRRFRTVSFPDAESFYGSFYEAVGDSPWGGETEAALADVDTDRYLPEKPFYTPADRRFRYVRDEILGRVRYDAVMGGMMAERKFSPSAAAGTLWMDAGCLRRLAGKGHVIGLHSHTHPTKMAGLPAAEQEREFAENQSLLANILGWRPDTMAHPAGSYDGTTLTILCRLGVRLGFRADMGQGAGSPLEWPRMNQALLAHAP
jgi:peptidoglycan/xylan/chitin deacetylase (PgdA/CDA1 family)